MVLQNAHCFYFKLAVVLLETSWSTIVKNVPICKPDGRLTSSGTKNTACAKEYTCLQIMQHKNGKPLLPL